MEIAGVRQDQDDSILGLDIGAASIGWALVELRDGEPHALKAAGVRVFEAGVEGDIASGRDQSRAAKRREARSRRRLLWRRRHRLTKLAACLQQAGLLPPGDLSTPAAIDAYFIGLDRELFPQHIRTHDPHLMHYRLRARAPDEKLTPYQTGRAIYHLAQRRGFLSNRRETARPRADDDEGVVKKAIGELEHEMRAAGARTLGEHLSRLNPEHDRVRGRYISRAMIEHELDAIWQAQASHYPDLLTDDLKTAVRRAILHQRPLKSPRRFIGFCDLERDRRRAPLAILPAQRHRLLQKVNDLKFIPNGELPHGITPEQRAALADALETNADLSFPAIRKLLSLKGGRFNFETEGEKGLIGNKTAARLITVFGEERWAAFTPEQRNQIVDDLRTIHTRDARKRRAISAWNLDDGLADRFADLVLEDGHHSLSRQALARVLPLMEEGQPFATARKACYPDHAEGNPRDLLPPLDDVMEVRNPTVERALTELRKVVNAVVRKYGKPVSIRIELARDLKRNRKQRQDIHFRSIANRKDRDAAKALLDARGITNPRRSDVEKWLLAEECGWICPYTGRHISVDALFGDAPQFEVEHIIPFPRCLDDSFLNKTLCHVDENRRKGNRTPWEAYHDTPQWDEIIGRVRSFQGGGRGRAARNPKVERFLRQEAATIDDFTSQQLNDTRYASRLAVEFVGQLYGAGADGVDPERTRRVQAGRGQITSDLRNEWALNCILGGGEKTRDDHRQHAIDAVVVALTDAAMVKRLSDAAARAPSAHRRRFAPVDSPWPTFLEDVRDSITGMVVSHRVSRKVAGPMHEDTLYGRYRYPAEDGKERDWAHVRKPLSGSRSPLSRNDIPDIVDPAVRRCVEEKLAALGETDPGNAFKSRENHPALRARDGRDIPIHKVRIRRPDSTRQIGLGPSVREVIFGSNHHVEVVETTDAKGRTKWEGAVVSTFDAMSRLKGRTPIVQQDPGPGRRFLFSLAGGEIIELDDKEDGGSPEAQRSLYTLRSIWESRGSVRVEFTGINDARQKDAIRKAHAVQTATVDVLRQRNCRKVLVSPLGEARNAGD
jgi:CRISPR-associated endonuclease Csn1